MGMAGFMGLIGVGIGLGDDKGWRRRIGGSGVLWCSGGWGMSLLERAFRGR